MKKLLILLVLWFVFMNVLNLTSFKLMSDRTSYELPPGVSMPLRFLSVPWLNFDGRNYLKITLDGYDLWYMTDLRAFMPVYPLLIRALSFNLSVTPVAVGLIISISSFIASIFVFDALMRQEKFKEDRRFRTVLSLLVFPTSFYFTAFYTESIFFLIVLFFFYFLNKRNFLAASLLTLVATATRVTGLALLVPLVYEAFKEYRKTRKVEWPVAIAPVGFLAYSLYMQIIGGGLFSVVSSQAKWNKPIGLSGPWLALGEGFTKAVFGSPSTHGNFLGRSIEVTEFAFAALLIALVAYSFKRVKTTYWLYMAASILPIFFSGVLSSVHRYMVVIFPVYFVFSALPKKYFYGYLLISLILLSFFASLFLRGYWVA